VGEDAVFPINAGGIVIEPKKLEWAISYRVVDVDTLVILNILVKNSLNIKCHC